MKRFRAECRAMDPIATGLASSQNDEITVMDGLSVGEVASAAWTILQPGAYAFASLSDEAAVDALRTLAAGHSGDPPLRVGETGIAAIAGFLAVAGNSDFRRLLALDKTSRVLCLATEGVTDPAVFEHLVS